MVESISITTPGQGLIEISDEIRRVLLRAGVFEGLCTVFIKHTSASLTIQENADPSAKNDLESWLSRLVQEKDPLFTHTVEGSDDMPAHIKAALTATSISIPVIGGELGLGTWQGIFLWEHRRASHLRNLLVHIS